MRHICLIEQTHGIGDLLFVQKLIDKVLSDGWEVVIPVIPEYRFLQQYIKKENLRIYNMWTLPFMCVEYTLPLQDSGTYYPNMHQLLAKYEMLRMNYDNWQDHIVFERFPEKEQSLMYRLHLENKKYNLIVNTFQSPQDPKTINIEVNNGIENINIFVSTEYTPFDWCGIIENATNLYFVDTCFTFIAEKLNLKAENMYLYSRTHGKGGVHSSTNTIHLFKKPWQLINP